MREVILVNLSRIKISEELLVSPGTKLVEFDSKAMKRPSADTEGLSEGRSPSWPVEPTEMRVVVPVRRSRKKISEVLLVSAATKLVELDSKAMKRPSAEIAGLKASEFPWFPMESTEISRSAQKNRTMLK